MFKKFDRKVGYNSLQRSDKYHVLSVVLFASGGRHDEFSSSLARDLFDRTYYTASALGSLAHSSSYDKVLGTNNCTTVLPK